MLFVSACERAYSFCDTKSLFKFEGHTGETMIAFRHSRAFPGAASHRNAGLTLPKRLLEKKKE